MSKRHSFDQIQTDRMEGVGEASDVGRSRDLDTTLVPLPTLREVLSFPVVARGLPEILAGENHLGRPIRWVHVSDSMSVASLLDGGELLLSTGGRWDTSGDSPDRYIRSLVQAGAVGLMLETVRHHEEAPPAMVRACRAHDFPLVRLRREVKFVSVTEQVHRRILSDQTEALRARAELHTLFTGLSLRGSPAPYILQQLGDLLGSPVILEDLSHRVVALGGPGVSEDTLLENWELRSRNAHRRVAQESHSPRTNTYAVEANRIPGASSHTLGESSDEWLIVPVEARGTRWGYLIALPGNEHPAGRSTVLEQGAVALALSRLSDKEDDEWLRRGQQDLLHSLMGGRYSTEGAVRERFEAAGIPLRGRVLVGMAIRAEPTPQNIRFALRAADASGAVAVAGGHPNGHNPQLMLALSISSAVSIDELGSLLLKTFTVETGLARLEAAIGAESRRITGLLVSLEEAAELLRSRNDVRERGITLYRSDNRPLLRLVTALGSDPRLHSHAEQLLKPLIEYDLTHGGDLLSVLGSYVQHPGNRTRAAAKSHLSRSVFYQRIDLIEDLLGMSLDDGEVVSALHTALLVRGK
ncbi:PucR family transcriptional regulator [Lysinibacter sp. HNR]|uniref:PucR family transcriptional regulator n=1 Tax=Lysinibacter sp. HNR TaxID=3031408 RepID=UPI002435A14A|nr:PucR family transcriptional regulator [Lysinibacter sp. HNR]WGD37181.1 PucR family transcriptional regulator [Lysinibacter sp. HNR]